VAPASTGVYSAFMEGTIVAYPNVLSAYKEIRVKTASQGQLIVMLYEEAVKQLDMSLDLLGLNLSGKKDPARIEQISKYILKTQEIITELMVSLDFDQGGDIAKNLFALYTWFNQELLEANISQDLSRITAIRGMINELRGAWDEIKNSAEGAGKPSAGVNITG
jgi:flagellar protein FliS